METESILDRNRKCIRHDTVDTHKNVGKSNFRKETETESIINSSSLSGVGFFNVIASTWTPVDRKIRRVKLMILTRQRAPSKQEHIGLITAAMTAYHHHHRHHHLYHR